MTATGGTGSWDDAYAGEAPPWDIGRPQEPFVRLAAAGALQGAVLDSGCGTGEHTILAAAHGARALGIDLSARAVAAASAKAAERGVEARFEVGDAMALPAAFDGSFDAVIDCGVFHVFDDSDRARYVTSLASVLRPGGHLHLMCFSELEPGDWGPRRVTGAELRDAFSAGWSVASLERERFAVNPVVGKAAVEAWLLDAVREGGA